MPMKQSIKRGFRPPLALVCALLVGPLGAARAASLVTDWNDQALAAVRITRMPPPPFSRALAIMNTAMYDAWAAYDKKAHGTQFGGELRRPKKERTQANRQMAMSYAAYRTLVDLFPGLKAQFDAEMARLGHDPDDTTSDLTTPQGVGNAAAAAVIQFRRTDGSNQLGDLSGGAPYSDYTGYQSVNSPTQVVDLGRWQPLAVPTSSGGFNIQSCLTPHWGGVKGFALRSYDQFAVPAPAQPGTFAFWQQSLEVIALSASLDDERKAIADWWSDGPGSETPPGTWILLAKDVSNRDDHDLDEDAQMFFALSNAMFDAGIACWGYKRQYDSVRPISAVRSLFENIPILAWGGEGQGLSLILGRNWRPYQPANFVTPPHADHLSGHSTFSAAAAETLKLFTGSDTFKGSAVVPAGSSLVEPGLSPSRDITLSWSTFSSAAAEAGISRLYGGIHFQNANLEGQKLGRKVAAQVYELCRAYIKGKEADD